MCNRRSHILGWVSASEKPSGQCRDIVTLTKASSTDLTSVAALWQSAGMVTPSPSSSVTCHSSGPCSSRTRRKTHATASAIQSNSSTQPPKGIPESRSHPCREAGTAVSPLQPGRPRSRLVKDRVMLRWCHFRNTRRLERDSPDTAFQGRFSRMKYKCFTRAQGKQNMRQLHHMFN